MASSWLPLELWLKQLAEEASDQFPVRAANYWNRYSALVDHLRTSIYPHINAGLACLSKSPGIYTDHGGDHFDEVVRYAGLIISDDRARAVIAPYALYILLSAIRLHDAGNIDGRKDHERRAQAILQDAGSAICPDTFEAKLIGDIAQAHGGVTDDNNKDTIGSLPSDGGFGPINCNPRMIAALVRFSDEICEHTARASAHHLASGTLPPENMLFHLYAHGIKQAIPDRSTKSFRIKLSLDSKYLLNRYPMPGHTVERPLQKYLLDDAMDRIQKLDTERRYCNRFLHPQLQTDRIEVEVNIAKVQTINGRDLLKQWKQSNLEILDVGYPEDDTTWRSQAANLNGEAIARELSETAQS